jgi:HAD superfamily phosphoserine phosphatase-like hydrolase
MRLAVFDLDGTITKKDTYLEFIKYVRGKTYFYYDVFILSPYIVLFYLGCYNNNKLKELFFKFFFKNYKVEYLEEKGRVFSSQKIPALSYKGALNVLNWHKKQNHDILIISASADIWLKEWCYLNNYKLIWTKFEKQKGNFTGRIDGENCFGKQKKKLLTEYLKKQIIQLPLRLRR